MVKINEKMLKQIVAESVAKSVKKYLAESTIKKRTRKGEGRFPYLDKNSTEDEIYNEARLFLMRNPGNYKWTDVASAIGYSVDKLKPRMYEYIKRICQGAIKDDIYGLEQGWDYDDIVDITY